MANERKTETLMRELLQKANNQNGGESKNSAIIEEQKSDNPRINKLLKYASKKGNAAGRPEFIVSFPLQHDLLIIVECKARTTKHKSKTLDQYSEFAVDGALLYASYLSKEFNVLAIGASGENKIDLQVDTYLQVKGEKTPRDLGIHKIYAFEDYFSLLKKDTVKEKRDIGELLEYSKVLNQNLRDNFEFEENHRPLIVSGILLALEDDGFRTAYLKKQKPSEIAELLITTIKERLEHDNIGEIKKNTMVTTYNFIKTNTKIINSENKDGTPNTQLRDLIKDIDEKVTPFLKNYGHYDVIGIFYNEFLRYANGDGGLGIVLTPKHITELFVDLAEVNKDSVVIDNCCGTGGFLISAMKRMEAEAKGDKAKIKVIHSKQIIGIENNPKMFVLACSNMMLRGDGKSNIYQQDCFQVKEDEIKKFRPTVGFLNPPYSKENGHKELVFVENSLNFLEPNATCIAILPQSCAMNTKKGNLEVKRRLLSKHTLKAVMSMPNTLFEDSNKNAVTCVMVFEAHKPHATNNKTWFGYWKIDGYIKVKPHGRIDYRHLYENKIRKEWLDAYFNKKEIDGFSVLRHVVAEDEWLVEPYISTRFENLKDEDFENSLREYATFLFNNKLQGIVSNERYANKKLELNFSNWGEISLDKLFKVGGSKTMDKKELDDNFANGIYPYVTTQTTNNGVRGFYKKWTDSGNILTVDSATVGFCAYQPLNFSASDHVEKLVPLFELNVFRAMFLVTVINMEQYRYSYGRKFNQDHINATVVKLPMKNKEVDWDFIEQYMAGLPYSKNVQLPIS